MPSLTVDRCSEQDGAEASHLVLEEGDIVVRIYPKTAQTLGKFATLLLNLGA